MFEGNNRMYKCSDGTHEIYVRNTNKDLQCWQELGEALYPRLLAASANHKFPIANEATGWLLREDFSSEKEFVADRKDKLRSEDSVNPLQNRNDPHDTRVVDPLPQTTLSKEPPSLNTTSTS